MIILAAVQRLAKAPANCPTKTAKGISSARYAHTFTEIGRERGWPPVNRAHFDALRGRTGALFIGDAETVAEKILYVNEALGGISRVSFQMTVATLPQIKLLRATELLGTEVVPLIRSGKRKSSQAASTSSFSLA